MADAQAEARVTGLQWRVLSGICWHIANIKGRSTWQAEADRTAAAMRWGSVTRASGLRL